MSKIKHILSVIHYTIHGAVCFQSTHFPCDDWDNMYILSYYHHQIGSMNYYPLFSVRPWNNGMRCMFLYILTTSKLMHIIFSIFLNNFVYVGLTVLPNLSAPETTQVPSTEIKNICANSNRARNLAQVQRNSVQWPLDSSQILLVTHTVQSYVICGLKQYLCDLDIGFNADFRRP